MKKILLAILCGASSVVCASELRGTTITKFMMDNSYGEKLFIQANGSAARDGSHCHVSADWDFVLSTDSEFGKQVHSQLLMAFAANKKVNLIGTDICIVNGNIEGLRRVEIY